LQYAAVMGIQKDLRLVGNDFSNTATFLFVGLLCFEVPNSTAITLPQFDRPDTHNLLPPKGPSSEVAWSECRPLGNCHCQWCSSDILPHASCLSRLPGYLRGDHRSLPAPHQLAAPRFSLWYCGLGFGQIIGGAISYGFQHVTPGAGLAGWRIMFVALGCLTVVIGLGTVLLVSDTPMQARWLTDADKVALLKHVSVNRTGIQSTTSQPRQILGLPWIHSFI